MLAHEAEAHRGADLDGSGGGLEGARHEGEQRGLARTVCAEDAVAVPGPDDPRDVVDHARAALVCEAHVLHLDDLLAQTAHGEALELERVPERGVVRDEGARRLDAELRLARARLGAVGEPVELLAQRVLAALLHDGGLAVALDALLDVGGVAALEGLDAAVVDLPHVLADLVEEPPVVRDHEEGARAGRPAPAQVLGEPLDGREVKMVGGLVHADDVPGAAEHAAEVHATSLAAGELPHGAVEVEVAHELAQDGADARVGGPGVLRHVAEDGAAHGVGVVQPVGLAEVAHRDAAAPGDGARVRLERVPHDLEQRRLPVAVAPDDADALALVDSYGLVLEHALARPLVAHVLEPDEDAHYSTSSPAASRRRSAISAAQPARPSCGVSSTMGRSRRRSLVTTARKVSRPSVPWPILS